MNLYFKPKLGSKRYFSTKRNEDVLSNTLHIEDLEELATNRKMTSEVWDSTSSESESYEVWKKLDKVSYIECRGFGFCVVFE